MSFDRLASVRVLSVVVGGSVSGDRLAVITQVASVSFDRLAMCLCYLSRGTNCASRSRVR